jgi:hypothetical protein
MQLRFAPLLSRALVAQPIEECLKYDQREPDLLRLSHPALSFDGGFWNEAQRVKRSGFGRLCQAP